MVLIGFELCDLTVWARKNWAALSRNCFKIGHSYEALTYLFGQSIFIRLLSAKQKYFCRSFEINRHGKFQSNPRFWPSHYSFFQNLVRVLLVAFRANSKFPGTSDIKRSTKRFFFPDRRRMKIFQPWIFILWKSNCWI